MRVNGTKLHSAVKESAFTFTQVADFIGHKSNYFQNVKRNNTITEDDLYKICALIKKKPDTFKAIEPPKPVMPPKAKVEPKPQTYEPPVRKPMTAREDPNQNWMINIYRAIEDMNDRIDILIHETKEQTAAIRGLSIRKEAE